jgi:hypothetical protein
MERDVIQVLTGLHVKYANLLFLSDFMDFNLKDEAQNALFKDPVRTAL